MIRTISATRYVTPLREGGSMPAIVEADDFGLYVLKFRGAGQGVLALAAELICAGIGRALDLPVPEVVFASVDSDLGRNEGDPEIRELLQASVGNNLAMDYLPGSAMFDPAARDRVDPELAARTVWFDALITNVDRTARNPNLLCWHRSLYLIDHGAALYFHHDWSDLETRARSRFPLIRDHVLLPWAAGLEDAGARLRPRLTRGVLEEILRQVPDEWLPPEQGAETPEVKRAGYVQYFLTRLEAAPLFIEEAQNARARLV
ncbi:MAG: aminotransferase class I and II [Bryobacterales bacterium]|nr:aminotransferase class I and II [Bryobacterales bacterium]